MADALPGGWSDTKDATEDIKKITHQVKAQAEGKTNKKYLEFHAVKFRKQTVAGTNYLIKVHAGLTNYLHLRVYQKLPCDGGAVSVTALKDHHHKDDPLVPF